MRGCVYDGTLKSEHPKGGLVGWSSGTHITLEDCLFNGTVTGTNSPSDNHYFHPIGCNDNTRPTVSISNCYYTLNPTQDENTTTCLVYYSSNKGKFGYTITGASGAVVGRQGNPTNDYNLSEIDGYSVGIVYKGTPYAGNGESIPLSLSSPGFVVGGYTTNHGTLTGSAHTGSNDPYTLVMQAYNTVINARSPQQKFHIANTSTSTQMTWAEFAAAVNHGTSYSGQTVYLDEDISEVNVPVGTVIVNASNNYDAGICFEGTFEGGGHTMTVNLPGDCKGGNAPFRSAKSATFRAVVVEGTVESDYHVDAGCSHSGGRHPGGLVGYAAVSCTVENCLVKADVGTGADYAGGIIGHALTANIVMRGCVYTGTITSRAGSHVGGLIGWSDAASAQITNCFFAGNVSWQGTGAHNFHPIVTGNMNNGVQTSSSVTNTYFTKDKEGSPTNHLDGGKHAYSITGATHVVVARRDNPTAIYNVSKLNAYNPALVYDGTLYAGNAEVVPLSLGCPGYAFSAYSANHGTLSGTAITGANDPYTLTMQAYNTVISVTSPVQKFHIANASNTTQMTLSEFAAAVNAGTTYSGQTVYVDEDIANTTVTVGAGTPSTPFQGTFEGNGHIVNYTCSANVADKGLIGYVSGAGTIKNVFVNATLSGTSTSVGTIAGTFAGTGTIVNVEGSGTISGSATNMGGLVGNMTGGTLHSSFAVAALNGTATNKGGLVGANGGNLYNSYSNATYSGTASYKGGLVGANSGTVENCYAAGIVSGVSALAGSNSGTIEYCYADAVGDGYVGTSGTAPSGCGLYGSVQSNIKHLNYMYRDNLITKGTNTYVGSYDAIADGINVYINKHIPVWNGLVSALNQWVRANPRSISGLAPWYRPLTTDINGDLPVLGFKKGTSLGAVASSPKVLRYGTMDGLLTAYNGGTAASIFHYGKAKGVANVPSSNVSVYIAEDAVLLQSSTAGSDFSNTTVGVTFDNSDHGQHSYDYWGTRLHYDWHFMSSPLYNPLTGAEHTSYMPSGSGNSAVDISAIGGYFPAGLPMGLHDEDWKWDFYSYYEPEYHWINLKRNKKNHYHQDGGAPITYNEADQDLGDHTAHLIPGKGYMMAVSQTTFMNQGGTLNRGDVPVTLTNQEPEEIGGYGKGWNLVGNPYQAYLDLEAMDRLPVYIYDAETGVYVPYAKSSSTNPVTPSRYIHPHQAFFMRADGVGATEAFTFQQSWADTTSTSESYYRDVRPSYPLVNLFVENSVGQRDLAVVEFRRPEAGGAEKFEAMRSVPFTLSAHHGGKGYGVFFATDELERVPLHFKSDQDDLMTLTWDTHNGVFTRLCLVDNMTGAICDMLTHDSYSFTARATDYASRFYITSECSGTGVVEAGTSAVEEPFAYVSNGNIVIDMDPVQGVPASLQVIDMLGRVVLHRDGVSSIPASGLSRGVYVLRVLSGKAVRTQKIVIE